MARPKKAPEERRSGQQAVRLTRREQEALDSAAAVYGLTVAEFMRRRALGERLPAAAAAQRQTAVVGTALIRLGVNLNQIAHHMNAGRAAPDHLGDLISRIDAALDRLYGPGSDTGEIV